MTKIPTHALVWSEEQRLYEWYTQGQVEQRFHSSEEARWLAWLRDEVGSFAFHSPRGSLKVYREQRPRGGLYWYAYHSARGRTRKRYLGQTENLMLARLEETARTLASDVSHEASHEAPSEPQVTRENTLLTTMLTVPRLPGALVARERLLVALDGSLSTPLTLLAASAGWGKTTLLATWVSRQRRQTVRTAWLSLDELDNTPTRFWVALIAALRRSEENAPNLGATALALLQSPQLVSWTMILTSLLQELEGRMARATPVVPVALIVDDYQAISDPAIHESMNFFVAHLPAHVHLLISSRVDPDLPLARLRARGQLTEIRMDDLRFNLTEASEFLHQMFAQPLSDEEVRQLTRRTEGWAAGLQLAALTLQKRMDRAAFLKTFTGDQRYLLDYVQEEILARLPARIRDFLLQIAILSRLSAEVCQIVTAQHDIRSCQQMLEELERANLFVAPLDEKRGWYRLHDLFREALLAALETTHPDLAPELHRRAASFYQAQGEWAEAIAHCLAASDYSAAAHLMEQTVEEFWVHGEAATMAQWVQALPQQVMREHARLALTTALYLLNTVTYATSEQRARTHTEVRRLMARVEAAIGPQVLWSHSDNASNQNRGPHRDARADGAAPSIVDSVEHDDTHPDEEALLQRRLRTLRMALTFLEAASRGEHERLDSMEPEIQELEDAVDDDEDEDPIWRLMPLSYNFVLHYTVRREGAQLLPQLLTAQRQVSRSGSPFATIKVMQYVAVAAHDAGRLRLAYGECLSALDLIEQIAGYAVLKGYFEMTRIEVLYQWNRLEQARSRLHAVLHDPAIRQHLDMLGGSSFALMRVELARRDLSAAEEALCELERLVQSEGFGTYPGVLPAIRAHWRLALGQVAEVAAWAASIVFPEGPWESSLYFNFRMVIRAYFAQRRWRGALELLERWRGHLDRTGNIGITIMYLAQLLVALYQTGQSERAIEVAVRLFALTEPEGYLRIYLDEGEPMRKALQALLARRTSHGKDQPEASSNTAYIAKLLAAFEQEQHGTSRSRAAAKLIAPPPSQAGEASVGSSMPDISLTRREQDVLRLLATGASNQEIARTLMIELPTVKKHVSNLLGKFGAASRTQAVAQAHARSLL